VSYFAPRSIALPTALLATAFAALPPRAGSARVDGCRLGQPGDRWAQESAEATHAPRYGALCGAAPDGVADSAPHPLYEAFGFSLFRDAVQQGGGNLFLSPAGAGFALAMAYTGARGRTRDDMARSLGFDRLASDEVAAANAQLLQSLGDQHDVELHIANALWSQQGVPLAREFIAATRRDFGADAQTLDLHSPDALVTINGWVARKTNGKIPTILSGQPDPSAVLVLTNAVYFKGKWGAKFDSTATRVRAFTHADGSQVPRRMMTRTGTYAIRSANHVAVLRLPYSGNRFSLYVMLPDSGAGLDAIYRWLDPSNWDALVTHGLATVPVHVVLPRFTIRTGMMLNSALKRLGMSSAFSASEADFSGMMHPAPGAGAAAGAASGDAAGDAAGDASGAQGRGRFAISDVQQQTFIEVTEEGTEAAAATAVTVTASAVRQVPEPVQFIADHPFVAVLRDDHTGAILFIGQVVDP